MPISSRLLALLLLALLGCSPGPKDLADEVPVRVGMVAVDNANAPVVVLEEESGERWLPIWIGTSEAHSIASEMDQREPARPNTHDLANQVIHHLEGELVRVVVTALEGGTYFALMTFDAHNGRVEIDARPSDAIAIALASRRHVKALADAASKQFKMRLHRIIQEQNGRKCLISLNTLVRSFHVMLNGRG